MMKSNGYQVSDFRIAYKRACNYVSRSNFQISKFTSFQILFCLVTLIAQAQEITAYNDYLDHLMVFDKGMLRQAEYLKVASYKIGGNAIAYIDNKNDFKVYYDGQTFPMVNAADFKYAVSDNLIAFSVGDVLYAFDEGQKRTLCYYAKGINVNLNDSILVYFDDSQSSLNFYYRGRIVNAEDALLSNPKTIKTGSNTVAWINQSNEFMVFYRGISTHLDVTAPRAFAAGRDIVAYVDDYEQRFRLFYKGDTAVADEFAPDSFKVGFGIMAYIDHLQNFRIFYNGATKKILSGTPDFFRVKGNVVVYSYNNTFNVFYEGNIFTLQNKAPVDFQLSNDGVAWLDDSGRLMLFLKGKTYNVSYETINKYFLNGNVLKYEVGVNTVNVFYNGRNY